MLTADETDLLARHLADCPDCGAGVIACDNGLRLDLEPDETGLWGFTNMGGAVWAVAGDDEGSRHNIHEHQAAGEGPVWAI